MPVTLLRAVAAYLLGCVPTARLTSRLTNGRAVAPVVVALAAFLKGFVAALLFAPLGSIGQALIVTAVVAGDQWPVFGREAGRTGLWTLLGALSALTPIAAAVWVVLWALAFVATGYKALGMALSLALLPFLLGFIAGWPLGWIALPGCFMVLERGRGALQRIRAGEEPKHHWKSPA
jgi:glycerol-3-phosphate acyltransferase PlsY